MNLSSIGSPSAVTSGFLSEPPLSPGAAPAPAPIPQLRTVDSPPASDALSAEPQAPPAPVAPAPPEAPAPSPPGGAEAQGSGAAPDDAPAAPAESPSLESTLLRMRLVTPDQIASAMREEAETGRSIAEIVVANGWVTAEDLARLQAPTTAPTAALSAPEPVAAAQVTPSAPTPAPEPPAPAAAPAVAAAPEPPGPAPTPAPAATPQPAHAGVGARVLVRLENGERIEVGAFDGFEAAKERARGLMAELQQSTDWPFLSGRFVRPEAIVSIDVDLTSL
jgi:hypothetical protein